MLVSTGVFRLWWGWQLQDRADSDFELLKPELKAFSERIEKRIRTESYNVFQDDNQAFQLSKILDEWPRFTKYASLVTDSDWWQFNRENRGIGPDARQFKDPVTDEKAYISTCMDLVESIERAAAIQTYKLHVSEMSSGGSTKYIHLTALLADLSWRLMKRPAGSQAERRAQLADLIRLFKLPPTYNDLCRSTQAGFMLQLNNRYQYHTLLIYRLGELFLEDWRDPKLSSWAHEMIQIFGDHSEVKANLIQHCLDRIYEREHVLREADMRIGKYLIYGEWLSEPLAESVKWRYYMSYYTTAESLLTHWNLDHLKIDAIDKTALKAALFGNLDTKSEIELNVYFYHHYLAAREMLMALLAIKLYEADHNTRPSKLSQLIPDYIKRLPIDYTVPGGEAIIKYVPEKKLLYALGENTRDESGHPRDDIVVPLDGRTHTELWVAAENIDVTQLSGESEE